MTVNSNQFAASGLTTSYKEIVSQSFKGQNGPVLNYYLAKKNNNNLVLAPSGRVYNYSSSNYHGRMTNLLSVTVNYTGGTLYVQEGIGGEADIYNDQKITITSGTIVNFESHPNYIMISNKDAETTITSMTFSYTCTEAGFSYDRLGKTYTAKAKDGTVYTLTRNGSSVTMGSYSGSISVANGGFALSLSSGSIIYSGVVSSDYKTLEVTSQTTNNTPVISSFNRVYVMDDFEHYTNTGTGYTAKADGKYNATMLRAAYYGDYGGGGYTTWVTSSSFNYAISSDYLNLTTAVKHGGSKAATIKGWSGGWTRLWSIDTFNANNHSYFGQGDTFSFWTHGAYTNTGCTSSYSGSVTLRAQVYYQYFDINDGNRNSTTYGTGTKDFTISANEGWKEQTITLNPDKKVYAVNFMINNSGLSSDVYVPVDDLTIYTKPVYEPIKKVTETSTKITKTYHGSVTLTYLGRNYNYSVKVGLGANGYIYAYAGENMVPTGYTISGSQIVITTTGSITVATKTITYGNWTGTLSNNNSTITINKSNVTGTISSYIKSSQIVLNEDTTLVNGEESYSTLTTRMTRQQKEYDSGGNAYWANSSSEDVFKPVASHFIQGSHAIKASNYTYGYRLILNPTYAQNTIGSVESVSFWVYAPAGTNYTIRLDAYDAYDCSGSNTVCGSISSNGSDTAGWRYMNCGLAGTRKNFMLFVDSNNPETIVDYITYF